jgi:hypothetical protein
MSRKEAPRAGLIKAALGGKITNGVDSRETHGRPLRPALANLLGYSLLRLLPHLPHVGQQS